MTPGSRIKFLRKQKGLNQTELGEVLGVTLNTVFNIESGKTDISTEVLKSLSEYFGVSIDYLVTGKEEAATISPDEQEFIKAIRQDLELWNTLKEAIEFKKKVMLQIKRLSQRSLEEQHLEHA
jgi:transcriptional regulator with XRE-family HTH domain